MKQRFFLMILFMGVWSLTFRLAHSDAAWQQKWEETLQAAKKEGSVAVAGSIGTDLRDFLTIPFTKKFGIQVNHKGFRGGSGMSARVGTERRAGKYLWDIAVTGTSTALRPTTRRHTQINLPCESSSGRFSREDRRRKREGKVGRKATAYHQVRHLNQGGSSHGSQI